jgi:hypothetical protein
MEHVAIDLGGRESQVCIRSKEGEILLERPGRDVESAFLAEAKTAKPSHRRDVRGGVSRCRLGGGARSSLRPPDRR